VEIFVQFTDSDQLAIRSVFGEKQCDEEVWPNQGVVEEDDPRYLAWLGMHTLLDPELPTTAELIAAERYKREAVGINFDSLLIDTTRDSQALIASMGLSAVLDSEYRCNFKTVSGFVEIGGPRIIDIAKAVRAHVQACFDREKALLDAVSAGTYRDVLLAEGWPDSSPLDSENLR
jgi:hypothetical protein